MAKKVFFVTTIAGAHAVCAAIQIAKSDAPIVRSLQEVHQRLNP
jgi:hypothetical protein